MKKTNKNNFYRPYIFSLKLASLLVCFNLCFFYIAIYNSSFDYTTASLFFFVVVSFFGSFFIVRLLVEKYIYKKINLIYKSVSILDVKDVDKQTMTTDLETLKREVIKFAETKRLEIENLKAQEVFRREFIGNLSHELKTPLFTVQGYIDILEDGAWSDTELLKKYLHRASKGVQRLINITNDLDLITKLETGDLGVKIEPFAIDELTTSLVELLEIKAKEKNINLIVEKKSKDSIIVCADREKISNVLINLISNSIKYGSVGGKTVISFRENGNKILTSIKDNGDGIKNIHLTRIFERFYRVDRHRSREEGGSGLGLSIVKHVIEAHNEKIQVNSKFSEGSTFSFSLPICNEEQLATI